MLSVKGVYDGTVARPKEAVPFTEDYNVVITFLEPSVSIAGQNVNIDVKKPENTSVEERMNAARSLIGIIKGSTMTPEEARAERLARQ